MFQLYMNGEIVLDGQATGIHMTQGKHGTEFYRPAGPGRPYRRYQMPAARYSATSDTPRSGCAGRSQLIADVRALVARMKEENL